MSNIFNNEVQLGTKFYVENILVNPDKTDYIPLFSLTYRLYDYKEMIRNNNFVSKDRPLEYYLSGNSSRYDFNAPSSKRYSNSFLSKAEGFYFNNSFCMRDDSILYCFMIKSSFVKQMFTRFKDYLFSESPTFEILKNNLTDDNIDKYVYYIAVNYFKDNYSGIRNLPKDQVMFYINERKLGLYTGLTDFERKLIRYYKDVAVKEDLNDYIASKLFLTTSVPTFSDIDGPEKMVQEVIEEM